MSNLLAPKWLALDRNGTPLVGATWSFYETGASVTPKAVYATEAHMTAETPALGTSLTADASGRCPTFFALAGGVYRVVHKTSAGVTIWTEDNLTAAQLSSSGLSTRLSQIATTPLDYGALGDGVADESAAVQSAVDDAGGTMDLCGLTFRCDSAIVLSPSHNGVTIRNGTLNFSQCAADFYLKIAGTVGTYTNLTANATLGDSAIACTAVTGFAVGDMGHLKASATYTGGAIAGEIATVKTIAGLNVTLNGSVKHNYTTANGAAFAELTPVQDVTLENVTIIGSTAAAGTQVRAIHAEIVRRMVLKKVTLQTIDDHGLFIGAGLDCRVEDLTIDRVTISGAGVGAGIYVDECSQSITFDRTVIRHAFDSAVQVGYLSTGPAFTGPQGQCRDIVFRDTIIEEVGGIGFSVRQDSYGIVVDTVRARDVATLISGDCPNVIFRDVKQDLGTGTVTLTPKVPNISAIFQVEIDGLRTPGAVSVTPGSVAAGPGDLERVIVQDVYCAGALTVSLTSDTGADMLWVAIKDIVAGGDLIVDVGSALATAMMGDVHIAGVDCDDVVIDGDSKIDRLLIERCVTRTFYVQAVTNLEMVAAHIVPTLSVGAIAADIVDCGRIAITGGWIDASAGAAGCIGLRISATTVAFESCAVVGTTIRASAADAMAVYGTTASTDLRIQGCKIRSNGDANEFVLRLSGATGAITRATVVGNTLLRDNDTDSNTLLTSGGAGALTNLVMANNVIQRGTFGIEDETSATAYAQYNKFENNTYVAQTSGATSGVPYEDGLIFSDAAEADDTFAANAERVLTAGTFTFRSVAVLDEDVFVVDFAVIAHNADPAVGSTPTIYLRLDGIGGAILCEIPGPALAADEGTWFQGRAIFKVVGTAGQVQISSYGQAGAASATATVADTTTPIGTNAGRGNVTTADLLSGNPTLVITGGWSAADLQYTLRVAMFNVYHYRPETT